MHRRAVTLTVLFQISHSKPIHNPERCVETAKKFKVTIDEDKCKGCLICVHVCEQRGGGILKPSDRKTALGGVKPVPMGECIGCRWCERYCPDFAVYVEEIQDA